MTRLKFILFLFVFATEGQILPKNPLEENIINFLKKWQTSSAQTDSFPVPSLTSVSIPPVEYYYEGKGIRLNYSIDEMKLRGLDRFSIENISASEKSLEVSLTLLFPELALSSERYKLKGRAYVIYPLKGTGRMQLIFRDSLISATVRFGLSNNNGTRIEFFLLNYNVRKIEADLQNSSWPINAILNRDGVDILAGYNGVIEKALWNYLAPIVDNYLKDVPPSELLSIAN